METKNAVIESTMLGVEDHGIMSFYLYLDYGGSGQGAGGYCLDTAVKNMLGNFDHREGTAKGMNLIMKILDVVGVEKWEDLKGKHIRVKADDGKVYEIGNFLKEKWFNFGTFFKE